MVTVVGIDGALIDIHVLGTPRPKGSLRPFIATSGKPRAREQLAGSPDWRRSVTDTAYQAIRCDCGEPECTVLKPGYPRTGAVKVVIELEFVPPKKRPGPFPHTRTTGDADKHARNILDSLQDAGVVKDDAAVVDLRVSKRWSETGVAGARIVVWPAMESRP